MTAPNAGTAVVVGKLSEVRSSVDGMSAETGIAWWSEPGVAGETFLIVHDGRVVDCTPHAEPWALGRTSGPIFVRAQQVGATIRWVPLSDPPQRFQPHLTTTTRIRRWANIEGSYADEAHITFGTTDSGWYLADTREPWGWLYRDRGECWAECQRRMAAGRWVRVPANYDGRGRPEPDVEFPEDANGPPPTA